MNIKGKKRALGRGLSALVSSPVPVRPAQSIEVGGLARTLEPEVHEEPVAPQSSVVSEISAEEDGDELKRVAYIDVAAIVNNPHQPRQSFEESELNELAESIREHGLLQPVLVRPLGDGKKYEIIAGERRWRATKLVGLDKVPAIVQEVDEREALEIAIVENVQRSNLNPVEEAEAYQRLIDEFSLTQSQVAEKVSKDRASIANYLRLLTLPDSVRTLLKEKKITTGHAKAILTIKEPAVQISLAEKVVSEALSVRALEAIVSREVNLGPNRKAKPKREQPDITDTVRVPFPQVVNRMRERLGTKVLIKHHPSGRGRIEIEYFSEQELDRLAEIICE